MAEVQFVVDCSAPEQNRGMIHLGAGCVYIMRHTLLAYEDEEFAEALDDLARSGVSHLRCHYWLSDTANGVFPEGGAKCYREDAQGLPIYDWERMDKILDAWLERGMDPIFELSHVPDALTAEGGDQDVRFPVPNDYK